jgi:opacity protein-like surface antigen
MRKYSLHGLLAVILWTVLGTVQADFPSEGKYTGVSIGHSSTLGRTGLKRNSVVAEVFTGYGCAWETFYLGVEGYLKVPRNKTKSAAHNVYHPVPLYSLQPLVVRYATITSAKFRKAELGLDIRPGILMSPSTMLYGRIGTAVNRIYITKTTKFSGQSAEVINQRKKNTPGLRLGGGMEHVVGSNLSLRVDYVFTKYPKVSEDALQLETFPAKLNNHTTKLGLAYFW